MVVSGEPSMRGPFGWRDLEEGEVAAFPRGARGAHSVANRGEAPVRFLFFSEMRGPDVVIYPDVGAVGALEEMSSPERGGFAAWLRLEDAFERHDGGSSDGGSSPAAKPGRANLRRLDFGEQGARPGFRSRRARIGVQAGGERLGASVYELPPGQAPWPYHCHLANEELLVVLDGAPALRTPHGSRQLEDGEVVSFPVGERGLHQVRNDGEDTVTILVVSQMEAPDVVVHEDSRKVGVRGRAPGSVEEGGLEAWLPLAASADFWDGE